MRIALWWVTKHLYWFILTLSWLFLVLLLYIFSLSFKRVNLTLVLPFFIKLFWNGWWIPPSWHFLCLKDKLKLFKSAIVKIFVLIITNEFLDLLVSSLLGFLFVGEEVEEVVIRVFMELRLSLANLKLTKELLGVWSDIDDVSGSNIWSYTCPLVTIEPQCF